MSANTFEINQATHQGFNENDEIWLFGYGSLIYKVDFPFIKKSKAYITGWQRRFWQGSHDHRGTPDNPGRVVTLIEAEGSRCDGMAYKVTPQEFIHLDEREKNGYLRHQVSLTLVDEQGQERHKTGLIYIADQTNAAFLGEADEQVIAQHIARSKGPSGENTEYLLKLADSLRALGAHDEHVFELERLILNKAGDSGFIADN